MWNRARKCVCCQNYHSCGSYAIAFGLGITVSCFCPTGLILFMAALIITALGIIVLKH